MAPLPFTYVADNMEEITDHKKFTASQHHLFNNLRNARKILM